MPSEKTSISALKCARLKLRPNNVPEELPGRESEYKRIYGKVRSAIEQFSGCCICKINVYAYLSLHVIFNILIYLYMFASKLGISGQAGTGKTATVEYVMDNLKKEVSEVSEMVNH